MKVKTDGARLLCLFIALAVFAETATIHAVATEWAPADIAKVKKVSDVRVSPDGRQVTYTVTRAVLDTETSKYQKMIFLTDAGGANTIQLTDTKANFEDAQWSPDGKMIALVAIGRAGQRSLMVTWLDKADVLRVSDPKASVTSFKWVPSGNALSYTAIDTSADEEIRQANKNRGRVVDQHPDFSRVYVVDMADVLARKRAARQWTPAGASVSGGSRSGYAWSPTNAMLTFSAARTDEPNDWPTARLAIRKSPDAASLNIGTNKEAAEYSPHWSPDGQWLAYVASDSPTRWAIAGRVHVVSSKGGTPRPLADTFDGWGTYSQLIGWAADSKSVYYAEFRGTVTRVGRLPLDGPPVLLGSVDGVASGISLNARARRSPLCSTCDAPRSRFPTARGSTQSDHSRFGTDAKDRRVWRPVSSSSRRAWYVRSIRQ